MVPLPPIFGHIWQANCASEACPGRGLDGGSLAERDNRVGTLDTHGANQNTMWYAVQVRSGLESRVADCLDRQGHELFLPTFKVRRKWSDRVKELERPLFAGYLFCRFDANNRLPILMTPHVIQVLGVGKKPSPVSDAEIESVRAVIRCGLPSQPWPYLHVGQRVSIQHGPLRGLEGILLVLKGHHRIVVSVSLLQRSVALELDGSWVSPTSPQLEAHAPAFAQLPLLGRAAA